MWISLRETSDRCGKLSDSVAWRKPYQDFQDFRIYRMRDSGVNSSDRPYQIIERNDRPEFLRKTQAIAPAKLLRETSDRCGKLSDSVAWRKPYQDLQDFRIYRMRDSVVNSSDRPNS
ncbi:MAG: hypothetical protein HEQ20_04440 [Aphanizomenon flos-aquae KM1D3_PB]|nr:MAG: hypothetical protein HEQ20_04440 [Aphanizomenon flos-aquae KM1D3_PB]